jgi:hypothetical protein
VKSTQKAKSPKAKGAKGGKKMPAQKAPSKISRIFRNRKMVVLLVFVLAFSIFGSYRLYTTSAATEKTVNMCRDQRITLRRGSTGPCVTTVQRLMNAFQDIHDTSWPDLAYDGKFGAQTDMVVRKYQRTKLGRLTVDGVVGPQTWQALIDDCNLAARGGTIYKGCHPHIIP